jgi:hypothetical protein
LLPRCYEHHDIIAIDDCNARVQGALRADEPHALWGMGVFPEPLDGALDVTWGIGCRLAHKIKQRISNAVCH